MGSGFKSSKVQGWRIGFFYENGPALPFTVQGFMSNPVIRNP